MKDKLLIPKSGFLLLVLMLARRILRHARHARIWQWRCDRGATSVKNYGRTHQLSWSRT